MYHATAEYQLTLRMFKPPNHLAVHQRSVHQVPVALGSVSMPGCSSAWLLTWAKPCLRPIRHGLCMPRSEQGVMLMALPDMSHMLMPGMVMSHVHVSVLIPVPEHCQIKLSQSAASAGLTFMGFKPVFSTFHNSYSSQQALGSSWQVEVNSSARVCEWVAPVPQHGNSVAIKLWFLGAEREWGQYREGLQYIDRSTELGRRF